MIELIIVRVPTVSINVKDVHIIRCNGQGAVHKVRHARGGSRRCDSLWQGRGVSKSMWRHTFTNFSYIWNLKLKVMFRAFCCNRCIMTEGGRTKPPRTKPSRQKTLDKTPRTKTPANKDKPLVRTYVCMHVLIKIGGSEMCDKVWQREGVKIGPRIRVQANEGSV